MPPPDRDQPEPQPSSAEIPVDADDAVWGDANAPVTVVVFTDLECPYCARGHAAVSELTREYGAWRVRIVIKHIPLAMHPQAVPAARVAQAVLDLGGRRRFFEYIELAYANPEAVSDGKVLELARPLGLDLQALRERAASTEIGRQVLKDVVLADRLGVPATPHYRINGRPLTGALPLQALRAAVDAELAAAELLRRRGVSADRVYANRVSANIARPEPEWLSQGETR